MIKEKIKAVLFDMDGVITDSMNFHAESWQKVFFDYGLELKKEAILKREGMSAISSIIDIFKENGIPLPNDEEIKKLREKKLKLFETNTINIYPYITEILNFLINKKILLGLVTGSMRRTLMFMLPSEMINSFTVIVTVDEITNGKPYPDPYLLATEQINCKSKDILVIENAPMGILSAKRAGLLCFALETTLPASFLNLADKIFKNHTTLYDYLKENL